jgi:hypothetical protein
MVQTSNASPGVILGISGTLNGIATVVAPIMTFSFYRWAVFYQQSDYLFLFISAMSGISLILVLLFGFKLTIE